MSPYISLTSPLYLPRYGAFFDVTFKRWSLPFQGAMHDGKVRVGVRVRVS